MDTIISLRDVHFSYAAEDGQGQREVLRGVTLDIERGSFCAILGRNGSGKSTLARHLNGLLRPSSGSVTVCGIDVSREDTLLELRRKIGMVFQNPDNQLVATVVEEDVAFGPENLGLPPEEIRVRVDRALKQVGMYEMREHAPHLLSGGQKQRVAIAGVLAMEPECVVLDEPTAMLDPRGRRDVMNLAEEMRRRGVTVILITHHMEEAALADRVIVMDHGLVAADAAPADFFADEKQVQLLGLELPGTAALLHALRLRGLPVREDAFRPEDCAAEIARALRDGA